MRRALVVAIALAAPRVAGAEPLGLPEQPRPLGPVGATAQVDTAVITGADGVEARSATVVLEMHGRYGGWMLEASAGAQRWSDRIVGVGIRTMRGFQPTNPSAAATRWWRARADLAIGLHGAVMLGLADGTTRRNVGPFAIYPDYDVKAPSQMVRLASLPYDRPHESAVRLGVTARVEQPRWTGQLTLAADYVRAKYAPHTPDATEPRAVAIGGAGVTLAGSLAIIGHVLVAHAVRGDRPLSAVAGGGLARALGAGTVALRAEVRLDDCRLGAGGISGPVSGCIRVLAAYSAPLPAL